MSVVELRDVTFSYGGRPVVDGVSLDVAEGAFLGFVGPNGSGKTTLLELMVGLHRPDSGSVTLFDRPAHAFAEADLLVLDEPIVGVDAESRDAFYDLLHELNDEGLTVVLVEHDIGTVTTHASEIACLNRRLYFHGDPEGFVETGALAEAYGSAQHVVHHDHR